MSIPIETVRTHDFEMRFFRFGSGSRAFVILPGLSVQSVMGLGDLIAEAYQSLTEDYTVYLFDRRKDLPAVYPIREMARDMAEAIRALGLSKVALFGASQGGMIAMALAAEHPELVQKLVLGSSSAHVDAAHFELFARWIDLAKEGQSRELNLAFGEALYPKAVFESARELLLSQADSFTAEDLRRFVILAESLQGFDVRADLARIACPVLVLGAKDDRVLGAEASREIFRHLPQRPDSELYLYEEGFGHAAFDTAPDYKERLLRFLRKETAAE